jgi:hypothetical protein
MFGGWLRLSQWAREIGQKRKELEEQRESYKKRRKERPHAGGQSLRRIKLTAEEEEKLRAKITERAPKTTHGNRVKIAICAYMAIMIFGVVGSGMLVYIYSGASPVESVEHMVSCLIAIPLCVLWLKLSNILKIRSSLATIPGIILFILGSGLICFGAVQLRRKNVLALLLLGASALVVSYFLCFAGKNIDN